MKFKLFNVIWDFSVVAVMLHGILGVLLILLSFQIDRMGYYNIPYFLIVFAYIATEEHFSKIFKI